MSMTPTIEAPVAPRSTDAPSQKFVGRAIDRVDGPAKVTGTARFSAEYPYDDIAHAALVHSTIARGTITGIYTEAALAHPGVLAVVTHLNAPRMKAIKAGTITNPNNTNPIGVNYLNTDQVHWNGQPVALVVADSIDAALHAATLVKVTYAAAPSATDFASAVPTATPQKRNLVMPPSAKKGDAEAALARAAFTVDSTYSTPPHNHNAIEGHATTAKWDGDRLTVHDSTQNMGGVRKMLAAKFGVPLAGVRVVAPFVGGGFGGKGGVWAGTVLTVLASRVTGRPVRMMLTRESVYRTVGGRTPTVQRVALGADGDGNLQSLVHTSVVHLGRVGGYPEQVVSASKLLYASPNILVRQDTVELDVVANTFMRAPGESVGVYALESAVDELAYKLVHDPIALRMRNEPATSPLEGKAFSSRHLREAYAYGAEHFGWGGRNPEPRSTRDGRWLVGTGVATAYHPAWKFGANVVLELSADGTVVARCGFHEMGMGGATAHTQIVADALGLEPDAITIEYGDSQLPTGPSAGGSGQTASVAASLTAACEQLLAKVRALAAKSTGSPLEGAADGMIPRDGGLARTDRPGAHESYPDILRRTGTTTVRAQIGSDTKVGTLVGQAKMVAGILRDSRKWVRAAAGAQFCEVRVDADTGEVRVSRWLGVFDIGTVVNEKLAKSQLRGGIIMGIGMALSEDTLVDPRTGRVMNPSLAEYHVPVHADIPRIDVHCLDIPDPSMPLGVLGAGRGRHHGCGRSRGERGVPCDGPPGAGPADHTRQAAVSQRRSEAPLAQPTTADAVSRARSSIT